MKTKNYKFITGVLGCLLVACASSAQANEGWKHEGKDWKKHKDQMRKELGITDEQEKKLQEAREKNRAQRKELYEKIHAKKNEMRDELQKENFDINKVKAIHGELKALNSQEEDNRLESILSVRQTLTADQFHKFMELRKSRSEKWSGHKKEGKE